MVEDLRLARLGGWDEVLVQDIEDIVANLGELGLDLLSVLLDQTDLGRVALGFLLLLDGGNDSPRGTSGTDDVLVGDGKEIALLDGKITVLGGDDLHVLDHLCWRTKLAMPPCEASKIIMISHTFIALSLLGQLGEVHSIFVTHFGDVNSGKPGTGRRYQISCGPIWMAFSLNFYGLVDAVWERGKELGDGENVVLRIGKGMISSRQKYKIKS